MRVLSVFLIVFITLALLTNVAAVDVDDRLTEGIKVDEGIPTEIAEQVGPYEDFSADHFFNAVMRLLKDAFGNIGGSVRQGLSCCGIIIAAVLLCGIADASENASKISSLVGALAITVACTSNLSSMIKLGTNTIETMDQYSLLLLPGIASVAIATGSTSTSSALYLGTTFFLKLLMSLIRWILVPGIYMLAMLSAAEAALDNDKLKKLREFIHWLVAGSLKIILYVFTGYLTITGVIAGTTDAIRLKAAKLALSGTVPVVGGIISDASETLLTSAASIKNTIGTYGLIAVLSICLYPFLQIAVQHLLMKFTTALSGLIGKKCHVSLVENLTSTLGLVVGIIGTYSMIILICITIFIKIAV